MAITALDVRDATSFPLPARSAAVPGGAVEPGAEFPAERVLARPPAAVVAVAAAGLLEAVAVVAAALAGIGDLLTAQHRPPAPLVAVGLVALAAWVVACAAGGAIVLDGTGRRLATGVAATELAAVAVLLLVSVVVPLPTGLTGGVPVPIAALLALALPAGKLLLAGAESTGRWLVQGPRPRERRADPVAAHRPLCIGTLAVIGVVLGAVALLGPAAPAPHGSAPSSTASAGH